ncbi:LysE/ArgO family amino acid transporter [Azohydromonas sediminis]|uniref:LysE/ArgO family amino acid transporter n=1 Tax=Azohydromonas sediminis TaxID=2259674 RepID=UPI000E650E5B|nr:LysE family transporter [Azohydromonas sediminis]
MSAATSAWAAASQGFALGGSLIVAIGAQNAFVLRQGLRREHVAAIVVFCIVADALLMLAGIAGLASVLGHRPGLARALTVGGAAFLAVYGLRALWRALRPQALRVADDGRGVTLAAALAQCAAFTLLNPHVYLDTVLLVGSVGARFGEMRGWFAAGAVLASTLWFTALGFGARLLAPLFARPRAWQGLDVLIGAVMLALAALLMAAS